MPRLSFLFFAVLCGYGVLRLCGFTVMRLCGCEVLRLCGANILMIHASLRKISKPCRMTSQPYNLITVQPYNRITS